MNKRVKGAVVVVILGGIGIGLGAAANSSHTPARTVIKTPKPIPARLLPVISVPVPGPAIRKPAHVRASQAPAGTAP